MALFAAFFEGAGGGEGRGFGLKESFHLGFLEQKRSGKSWLPPTMFAQKFITLAGRAKLCNEEQWR